MTWRDAFDWENYSLPLVLRVAQTLFALIALLTSTALTSAAAGVLALILSLVVTLYGAGYFAAVSKMNLVKLRATTKLAAECIVVAVLLAALVLVASSPAAFIISTSAATACCVFLGFGLVVQVVLVKITYTDEYLYEKEAAAADGVSTPAVDDNV
ncbi:hypothetical protein DYB38_001201 [Aphanomyces astaci]|uniref:Uncharacterized protein n=1 Tax=Aphanomyces astaci TaxID=112090 RepID=A0A397CN67_APHAT|nr:hypothetical protein DYB34_006541 [Aphanomyces astaci]RHY49782.1 hypothetical protein DYB38_001201 [Aphanomyces astaci]